MAGVVVHTVVVFALICAGCGGAAASSSRGQARPPHIVFVMVDDFGWGDVGFHRETPTKEVVTPTMDALVKSGVELNRHYVHPECTPTRSSMLSGRLPAHVRLSLSNPCTPDGGIARNMTVIAAKMAQAGFETHQVGKWDAGMRTPTHTPLGRGFKSSLNYFGHGNWMWTENEWGGSEANKSAWPTCDPPACFKDLWDTDAPATALAGTVYEEELFRDRFTKIIQEHDVSKPLFLYYGSKVGHYPLEAPLEYQNKFSFIDDENRRLYAAMVNYLDDNLANMTAQLKARGMWDNTLLVLSSDNGGYVKAPQGPCHMNPDASRGLACFNGEAGANNYPLRGGKYCHFEGGIRANAFVSGGFVPETQRGSKSDALMHIADWYSTFCALAGVDPTDHAAAASGLPPIDSINMWPVLSGAAAASPRQNILVDKTTLVEAQYKLMTGQQSGATWSGPQYPNASTSTAPVYAASVDCGKGCLFDVNSDPTEHHDLAAEKPDVVASMTATLNELAKTIWQPPHERDAAACASAAAHTWDGFYGPWDEL